MKPFNAATAMASGDPFALAAQPERAAWIRPYARILARRVQAGAYLDLVKLGVSLLASPKGFTAWLSDVDWICSLAGDVPVPFDLARKPGRLFVVADFGADERARLLAMHYRRVFRFLGPDFTRRLLLGENITLAQFCGRSNETYRLSAQRPCHNGQEGELELVLDTSAGRGVASIDVTVGAPRAGEAPELWIGGLQGSSGEDSKAFTISVTKDLHGLRPKDLVTHAAYSFAELLQVAGVKAVTNAGHVHASRHASLAWSADYDAFWRELGGEPHSRAVMALPLRRRRRDVTEVAAAKRKAWLSRYALIDALHGAIFKVARV